jgi:two-component system, cell cycle sensor histidine kinase and response regulator CckA
MAPVEDPTLGATRAPEGGTVLVADDDPGVRTLVALILRRAGYTVVQASNGRQACESVQGGDTEFDAALLDVMMPEMTGQEALPIMRTADPDLPVVFFSGFDHTEVADHLADPSAYTSFIPKPFENADLVDEIARAIRSRR